jgi:hypothetical protein
MVDRPPLPPSGSTAAAPPPAAASAPAAKPAAAPAPPAVRTVAETMVVPSGTQIIVRLATDVSSDTATAGDRFQGFLDLDFAADGRLVAPRGGAVYGIVTAVEKGSKSGKEPSLSVTLTDMKVGDRIVSINTQPLSLKGEASKGARKVVGGALLGAVIGGIAGGGQGAAIGAAVGGGAGGVAAAAGSVTAAAIPAQTPQAFTLAVPLQVDIMTNVAVR